MILFEPEVREAGGRVVLAARVEMAQPRDVPQDLIFEFPAQVRSWLTERSDPFVTALLLVAMQHREAIEVRGRVSARLLLGLDEYQRAFQSWFPWRFQRVDVRVAGEDDPVRSTSGAVACAFSGGVDSFYTLWSHVPASDGNARSRLSHALFVHGFDIPLANRAAFDAAALAYRGMGEGLGVELIGASCNAQAFVPPLNWGVFHGAPLVATALALGAGLCRFYVPSSHTYLDTFPWGSDPRVDHLLSTETLDVVHDGASASRIAKTAAIAAWPPTHGRLRVCSPRADGQLLNCCACEKCVRTMVTLDLLGELGHHASFPLPLDRRRLRACRYRGPNQFSFPRDIAAQARELERWDVVRDVAWAVAVSRAQLFAHRVKVKLIRLARRLRRRGRPAPDRAP